MYTKCKHLPIICENGFDLNISKYSFLFFSATNVVLHTWFKKTDSFNEMQRVYQ